MKKHLPRFIAFAFVLCAAAPFTCLGDEIPKAAWRRPLGQPLDHPGVRKNNVDIDDGYWQGAPVGGFGAGTFSRTYRGDFARWHIKTAVHKYETVFANQFAMFQKADGDSEGIARVLMNGHPADAQLSSWQWDYPVGAGEYAALHPKSWYDYKWEKFPFSLAALFLSEGMKDEAFQTAWGVYHVVYETKGYWFRTPEAWNDEGNFRAPMYMRPAAVWAMEMVTPSK